MKPNLQWMTIKFVLDFGSIKNVGIAAINAIVEERNENGEYDTDFVDCTLWQGVAENTAEYCRKGDILGVKGRLETSIDQIDEKKIKKMNLVAEKVTFLSSKSKENDQENEPFCKPGDHVHRIVHNRWYRCLQYPPNSGQSHFQPRKPLRFPIYQRTITV